MIKHLGMVLIVLAGTVAAAHANDFFGMSPEALVAGLNASIEEGGGNGGFASLGPCSTAKRSCELSIYGGVVTGVIATSPTLDDIEALRLNIGPSNDMNGVFFAAIACAMEVLVGSKSTSHERQAAMMNIVQTITTKDVKVEKTVGGYRFIVDAIPKVGIHSDIFVPLAFDQLDRFSAGQ